MAKKKFSNIDLGDKGFSESLSNFVVNKEEKTDTEVIKKAPKKESKKKSKENLSLNDSESMEIDETALIMVDVVLPSDFKSHSVVISNEQLAQLRRVVNYNKWKKDPKYSIQQAVYEALELLFVNRVRETDFPNDFVTYSPAFSMEQWGRLNSFVGEMRFKENPKYAIKYAVYDAISIYLKVNKISDD